MAVRTNFENTRRYSSFDNTDALARFTKLIQFRGTPRMQAHLEELARNRLSTTSALLRKAVTEFLDREVYGRGK